MSEQAGEPIAADPGLIALVNLLRLNGVGADGDQIRHQLGGTRVGTGEMLRVSKGLGLKARVLKENQGRMRSIEVFEPIRRKDGTTGQRLRRFTAPLGSILCSPIPTAWGHHSAGARTRCAAD